MSKIWILTKVLVKSSYRTIQRKGKKSYTLLAWLVIILCCMPLVKFVYEYFAALFGAGYTGLGVQAGLLVISFMMVMVVMLSFASIFYFSDDIFTLLPLPVHPRAIVTAKLALIFLSCAGMLALIAFPMACAWIVCTKDWTGFLLMIIEVLLCTLTVLLVLGILNMVIMRFLPFFANKDRFNLIVGFLTIALGIFIGFGSSALQNSQPNGLNSALMVHYLQNGGFLPMGMSFFFWLKPAYTSIVDHNLLSFVLSLLMLAACLLLFFWAADVLYLPAVTTASASGSSKKKGPVSFKKSSYFKSGFLKEMRLLVRNPVYVTNCCLSSLIMPIMMFAMIFLSPQMRDVEKISLEGMSVLALCSAAFCTGAGIGLFCGGMNNISCTAISREGTAGVAFMKSIPVSMEHQILIKSIPGFLFSALGSLAGLVVSHHLLIYPAWIDFVYIAAVLLCSWVCSLEGILCDGLRPQLVWENETIAVKNNYNLVITLLVTLIMLAILAAPCVLLIYNMGFEQGIPWCGAVLFLLLIVLSILMSRFVPQAVEKRLASLD